MKRVQPVSIVLWRSYAGRDSWHVLEMSDRSISWMVVLDTGATERVLTCICSLTVCVSCKNPASADTWERAWVGLTRTLPGDIDETEWAATQLTLLQRRVLRIWVNYQYHNHHSKPTDGVFHVTARYSDLCTCSVG